MKIPLKKSNHTLVISALAAGTALAGGLSWLFLSKSGKAKRAAWKETVKAKAEDFTAGVLSEQTGVSKEVTRPAAGAIIS